MIQGLLDLYEATFDEDHLKWALELQEKQNEIFHDSEGGGYFNVPEHDKSVLLRLKEGMPFGKGSDFKKLISFQHTRSRWC